MTAQEFIDWVQTANNLPNPTQAVKRAAQMMRVTEDTVWKWLNAKKPRPTPEYMQLLMKLLYEKYKGKKSSGPKLSSEERERMKDLFGKKPDGDIAKEFGLSRASVSQMRNKLGIGKYQGADGRNHQYDEEFIASLGKIHDLECAKRFGYSLSSIWRIRKKLGIHGYKKPRKPHKKRDIPGDSRAE